MFDYPGRDGSRHHQNHNLWMNSPLGTTKVRATAARG